MRLMAATAPRVLALLLAAVLAAAQTPQPVTDLLREVSEALANQDAPALLEQFDRSTPGYAQIREDVERLLGRSSAGSTIDILKDEGDAIVRTLDLDWYLRIDREQPRRQIVHCKVALQGRKWKIVQFEPVDFFSER